MSCVDRTTTGRPAHRPPDFSTWMMPLIIRRSSTRGTPRGLLGNSGASHAHCPSLRLPQELKFRSGAAWESCLWVRSLDRSSINSRGGNVEAYRQRHGNRVIRGIRREAYPSHQLQKHIAREDGRDTHIEHTVDLIRSP